MVCSCSGRFCHLHLIGLFDVVLVCLFRGFFRMCASSLTQLRKMFWRAKDVCSPWQVLCAVSLPTTHTQAHTHTRT